MTKAQRLAIAVLMLAAPIACTEDPAGDEQETRRPRTGTGASGQSGAGAAGRLSSAGAGQGGGAAGRGGGAGQNGGSAGGGGSFPAGTSGEAGFGSSGTAGTSGSSAAGNGGSSAAGDGGSSPAGSSAGGSGGSPAAGTGGSGPCKDTCLGNECGQVPTGCGQTLDCGECGQPGEVCVKLDKPLYQGNVKNGIDAVKAAHPEYFDFTDDLGGGSVLIVDAPAYLAAVVVAVNATGITCIGDPNDENEIRTRTADDSAENYRIRASNDHTIYKYTSTCSPAGF